jgi:hypothetical protein
MVGEISGVSAGRHRVSLRALRQALPQLRYDTVGVVVVTEPNGSQATINLPLRRTVLSAGGQVTYTISL